MKVILFAFLITMLLCLANNSALSQGQDSVLSKIDELKKAYQNKDIEKSVNLVKEIQDILTDKLTKLKKDATTRIQSIGLKPLHMVLKDAAFEKTTWSLSIQYEDNKYPPLTHENIITALDNFAEYSPNEEYREALRYRAEMKEAFRWFKIYCGNIAIFLPNSSRRPIPFRFADKDGNKCVMITDMASSTVYNTLRTTSKTRASKVLSACYIPQIKYLHQAFEKTDITYLGFTLIYGSKNFLEKSDVQNLEPEMLASIAHKEKCKQFIGGVITENEFVNSCDIYLSDRDMVFDIKKVNVQME